LGCRLIGDEMRVGKTPTAIAIDQRLRNETARKQRGNNCTLIACPKSVLDVWVDHLTWMGVDPKAIHKIDLPQKQAFKKTLGHIAAAKRRSDAPAKYLILNWDAVQTIKTELQRAGPWFHIIGDEIHRIKGRDTKRTTSFKRIKAKQLTGLSGTPADNRPEDFWSVLNWLRPTEYSSYWAFVDRYCKVHVLRSGFKKITGVNSEALPELRERIAPFYIRRMLADVADSLPQKQYRTIYVQMGARQRREYEEFDKNDIVDLEGGDTLATYDIVKLVRKQQMAIGRCRVDDSGDVHITDDSPKIDAIMEYIKEEEDAGPFIILAQHHDTVRLIAERIRKTKATVSTIIGTDGPEERSSAVRSFQTGKCLYFVGTIGACREGITLSRANTIIFVDRAWNPSWNRQAEARADSLDSHLPVTIVYFQTVNSIDEARRLRIDQKALDTDAMVRT
jgi:SNF2 family DNA or RNA helicase